MPNFIVSNLNFDSIGNKFEFVMSGPIMVQACPTITFSGCNNPVYYDPSHNDILVMEFCIDCFGMSAKRWDTYRS